ncbi:diaminobutyrate acetyltransferase [Pontibacillus marinus]|uniref:L-2,4-diaminobutyric acid acetyltransferase n=1 Tax=Pontibacillus marinus BH030004 = DSM 16465 TaxID=1385511 RepID=A0A0A5G8D3_9BACI|nr:diaminobutyrate acetyltransferase [Pontibacillus marinus]KGX87433.1 L-2,4-diaminobutyric acid acetyltransferase [Pontibacillus marinus BH030004 = DSM 16465]
MTSKTESPIVDQVTFDIPSVKDGTSMWELVNNSSLDQNSPYKYLMMCEYFSETCVVAKEKDKLVGFITAFIPPQRSNVIFIWQIGIDSSYRGNGIASKMLNTLVERESCKFVCYMEATVTPSNEASQSLFKRFARDHDTTCEVTTGFPEELFPEEGHEEELTFRIGPFS